MPSRFERYRVKDGVTRLGEAFLNPVFQDLDVRLVGLEALRISWEEAVRAVTDYGLIRVNEVIAPTLLDAITKADEIEAKRQTASTALTALLAAIDSYEAAADADILTWKNGVGADIAALAASVASAESGATADITAWKSAQLASLQAWQASLEGALPSIDSRLDTVEAALPGKATSADLTALQSSLTTQIDAKASQSSVDILTAKVPLVVVPGDAGNFTITAGSDGQLAVISGYGLYRFDSANADIADGETVIAPSSGSGNWVLVSPHWDFVWAYLAGLFDDLNARFLAGSAVLDFPSIAAGGTQLLTTTIVGAETTDRVILTAPDTLPANIHVRAYVSATDTLAVVANNVSAAAIDPAAMTFLFTVLKP